MNRIVIKTHEVMKRALDMLDISIDAFASSIGKDRATMYRYLNGEIEVPLETLTTLLDLVYDHGVDIIKVLNIENEEAYYYHATNKEICFPIRKSNKFNIVNSWDLVHWIAIEQRTTKLFDVLVFSHCALLVSLVHIFC